MHLLNTYALTSASKIDKPYIYTSYFPLGGITKYIAFQAFSKFDSKNYSLWQDTLNILYPVLEKNNIKIVQVGQSQEPEYQYVVSLKGKTNISQLAYVIENCQLFVGPDSFGTHLASSFDKPIVSLYSCSSAKISGPYWGDKTKQIIFEGFKRVKNSKPSYAAEESPIKSINTIRPEEVANAVFKLLNIDYKTPFETVYVGEKYSHLILRELIPNHNLNLNNPNAPIEVRMDLHFDEKILAQQLQLSKCVVITNKPIDLNPLKQFKPNIAAIVYDVEQNDEPKFIQNIRSLGVPIVLISYLPQEEINAKKINYYEIGKINKIDMPAQEVIDKLKADLPNLYFKSNKILAYEGQFYMTDAARVNNQPIKSDFDFYKVIDCKEFWQNLPFIYCVKKV